MTTKIKLKKGKLGILFWICTCLLGSMIAWGELWYSSPPENDFISSGSDWVGLSLAFTLASILASSPAILTIYFLAKIFNHLGKLIASVLILTYIITISILGNYSLSGALIFTAPYFVIAFILGYIYSRLELKTRITP